MALSAPEHDDRSSQHFQIPSSAQYPSSLPENDMLHPMSINFHHQRQVPAKHKRMQARSYYVEGDSTQRENRYHHHGSARGLHLPNSSFQHTNLHTDGQQMTGSSTSSSFSQTATSGLYLDRNPTQPFDPQLVYPLQPHNLDGMKRSHTRMSQNLDLDSSFDRGPVHESGHNSLLASLDVLTPQEHSWQQTDHYPIEHQLSTSAETDYGLYGLEFATHDPTWSPEFVQDPALGFADSNTLDHPGAIKIGGSSRHYKPDLPSSFPPTADCFPDYIPPMQNRAATPTSEPTRFPSSPPNLLLRRNSTRSTSTRASRSGSLSIIREYGHSQLGSPNLSRNSSGKGKRKGPLPTATAVAAAQKRKDGSVCIRCRTMKMTVGGCGRTLAVSADPILV